MNLLFNQSVSQLQQEAGCHLRRAECALRHPRGAAGKARSPARMRPHSQAVRNLLVPCGAGPREERGLIYFYLGGLNSGKEDTQAAERPGLTYFVSHLQPVQSWMMHIASPPRAMHSDV